LHSSSRLNISCITVIRRVCNLIIVSQRRFISSAAVLSVDERHQTGGGKLRRCTHIDTLAAQVYPYQHIVVTCQIAFARVHKRAMLGSAPRKTRSSRQRFLRKQSLTMRDIMALACISCILLLQLLMLLPIASAQPPLWSGMHADASRSNMGRVPGPLAASPVLIRNVSFPTYGKSHGTPAIDSRGRTFVVFWLQSPGRDGTPLLRRWDVDGSVHDVTLPTLGSDIIIDSNDALLLSDAGVAYITFSYYNPSACFNCTSLFAVRTPIPSHSAIV